MTTALVAKVILMTMKYSVFKFQDKFHTLTFTPGRLVRDSREAIGWRNPSSLITCKCHVANLPPLVFIGRNPEATALKLKVSAPSPSAACYYGLRHFIPKSLTVWCHFLLSVSRRCLPMPGFACVKPLLHACPQTEP